jgi:uncharacterized protein YcbX
MLTRSIIAALFLFGATASALSETVQAPADRARQWLVLVDDKNYAQSWSETAKAFQNRRTADTWASDATARRAPLGAVASRDLKSIDLSRGNAAVVRFDTVFAHKAAVVETITLVFENGSWSVTDYSVD